MRKILTAAVTTIALASTAVVSWGTLTKAHTDWYVRHYGIAPHASVSEMGELKERVEILAQFSQGEINARQVQRQIQIEEYQARCNAGRCTPYERQSLQNLREAWQREQFQLEQLRRQQAQQQQQQRMPYGAMR